MRLPLLAFLAILSAIIGLGALGYYVATLPTALRVAVGPFSNENVRIISAAVQTLQRERESFRLRLIMTEGSQQSSAALDSGAADLAVVRTDNAFPRSGASVAVMFYDHAALVAPGRSGIIRMADLKGKSIVLVRENPANIRLFRVLAAQAGLNEEDITIESVRLQDLRGALEQGRVHAVFAVGPTTGRLLVDVVNLVTEAGKGEITFIPIPETAAIEQRNPLIEADTLVRGLFGGVPPRPDRDISTVTVSHHLMASKSLSDATVSDFTRVLLNAKAQMAAEAPLASRMEAPDQEKASPIPIHPGTITYLDGQTSTFLERYGDWFYIGIMGLGLGGSAIAGYFSLAAARTRDGVLQLLAELEGLISAIPGLADEKAVAEAEAGIDSIFTRILRAAMDNNVDSAAMTAFTMAFAKARDALRERKETLAAQHG
ncbi:MAG: TAXI family TRAP transporter solute-binding subunit [Methylocystis sp.]|nr:TAXI family TRAP transporter solute-binding subunit [Methylocystis sp.]MCA3583303.1 TAXI family TRAP transporter solute-binding subunit [Methylocystis sp.]MCA3588088.1 TAXI family TRAP transporter solute-binding subunit [Methylocystis sp.]MCA3591470.1 TAXI family TRAP transporter solute-binding subunit [Methylocystis sp.]